MAVREFHITLTNNATATPPGAPVAVGVMLKKTDEYRCHGIYTDDVPPPDTINPGQTVEWASESDGVMVGCEGRVKYEIVAADTAADPHGFLCITWDNPFDYGVTYPPDTQINNSDVGTNDCEIQRFLPADPLGVKKATPIQFVTNGFEFDVNFGGHGFTTGGLEYLVEFEYFWDSCQRFCTGPRLAFRIGRDHSSCLRYSHFPKHPWELQGTRPQVE